MKNLTMCAGMVGEDGLVDLGVVRKVSQEIEKMTGVCPVMTAEGSFKTVGGATVVGTHIPFRVKKWGRRAEVQAADGEWLEVSVDLSETTPEAPVVEAAPVSVPMVEEPAVPKDPMPTDSELDEAGETDGEPEPMDTSDADLDRYLEAQGEQAQR
jgi:hypothetical protein